MGSDPLRYINLFLHCLFNYRLPFWILYKMAISFSFISMNNKLNQHQMVLLMSVTFMITDFDTLL